MSKVVSPMLSMGGRGPGGRWAKNRITIDRVTNSSSKMQLPIPVFAVHIVLFYNNVCMPRKKTKSACKPRLQLTTPPNVRLSNCLAILKPLGLITRQLA